MTYKNVFNFIIRLSMNKAEKCLDQILNMHYIHQWRPPKYKTVRLKPGASFTLTFPNIDCLFMHSMTLCLLRVKTTRENLYPKVKMDMLDLTGPNTHQCDYAGVQIMEPFGKQSVNQL